MRIITLAIAFLICTASEAQIIRAEPFYTAPEAAAAPSGDLLLDSFPGAAVAYSLRKLDKDYTGSAIRVRRSSDNTEQNIGFVNNYLDTASMKTFVGANNGFVVTWYNQADSSGVFGVRNVTQGTAANQPQIISSGAIIYDNGEVALSFDGVNDRLTLLNNFLSATNAASMFLVSKFDSTSRFGRDIIAGISDNTGGRFDYLLLRQGSSTQSVTVNTINLYIEGDFRDGTTTITDTNYRLFAALYASGVRRQVFANNTLVYSTDITTLGLLDDGTQFDIGSEIGYNAFFFGKINELIIWPSDQNNNRSAIQNNINSFYSIY